MFYLSNESLIIEIGQEAFYGKRRALYPYDALRGGDGTESQKGPSGSSWLIRKSLEWIRVVCRRCDFPL